MSDIASRSGETGLTALFIRRPVLAFVLNTLIAVAGLAAFYGVEIRELPNVDRAVVTVNTTFTGAAAETVDRELTKTIEGAVARVSGVKSISSTSSFGSSRVTIEFNDGVDLNVAASDVRDAVGRVANQIPEEADPPRIIKADANSDAVMRLAVTSDRLSVEDMTLIVEDRVEDALAAVPGVADVQVYGDRDKIFRIDVNQAKLAALGYTVADLRKALSSVAFDTPAGSITTTNQNLVVRTTADVTTPEQFGAIVVGGTTHIRDIATVTMGPDIGQSSLRSDGKAGIGIGIVRAAESNTLDISDGVKAAIGKIQENLPQGMTIKVTSDDAVFVRGAVHEVEIALGARKLLQEKGRPTRVVSVPCFELFFAQDKAYQEKILGRARVRVGIEAAIRQGWDEIIGTDGIFVGMTGFGASGTIEQLYPHFGITAEAAAKAAEARLAGK